MEIVKYWSIVVSVVTAFIAVALYFIKQWRDVEALKLDSADGKKKHNELEATVHTLTDRLISAIDKNNKENDLKIEKLRSEMAEKNASIEKEHFRLNAEMIEKLNQINMGIVEMRAENKGLLDKITSHDTSIDEYQKGRIEFYQRFGGVLDLLPKLINNKRNG